MTAQEIDRIECAIRHIESSLDVDPWAVEIAVEAMQKQIPKKPIVVMNDRDCDNCAHHTGGSCSVWECSYEPIGDDTISRQTAIDALHDEIVRRRIDEDINGDGALDEFDTEEILRQLPSAQPKLEQSTYSEQGKSDKLGVKICKTCTDTISRQAAIDAIMELIKARLEWISEASGEIKGLDAAYCAIEDLSSVPQNLQQTCNNLATDCISRQAVIDAICGECQGNCIPCESFPCGEIKAVQALPPAQPDIIVCADCKHWICHDRRCGYWNHGVKPLMWCSEAERREE